MVKPGREGQPQDIPRTPLPAPEDNKIEQVTKHYEQTTLAFEAGIKRLSIFTDEIKSDLEHLFACLVAI